MPSGHSSLPFKENSDLALGVMIPIFFQYNAAKKDLAPNQQWVTPTFLNLFVQRTVCTFKSLIIPCYDTKKIMQKFIIFYFLSYWNCKLCFFFFFFNKILRTQCDLAPVFQVENRWLITIKKINWPFTLIYHSNVWISWNG